jgi:DNA-binding NarL/FixJ family response regulator
MKRAVLAIRNRLVLEAVTDALKRIGVLVEKCFSQETERILALLNALSATFLVMDVTRSGDGTFDMRMNTVKEVKKQKPEVKIALLCDNVSDETIAYKIKRAKEEEIIDAFFYESVPSDYLADVLDSL